jgi:hypothetical protein
MVHDAEVIIERREGLYYSSLIIVLFEYIEGFFMRTYPEDSGRNCVMS